MDGCFPSARRAAAAALSCVGAAAAAQGCYGWDLREDGRVSSTVTGK